MKYVNFSKTFFCENDLAVSKDKRKLLGQVLSLLKIDMCLLKRDIHINRNRQIKYRQTFNNKLYRQSLDCLRLKCLSFKRKNKTSYKHQLHTSKMFYITKKSLLTANSKVEEMTFRVSKFSHFVVRIIENSHCISENA